MAVDWWINNVDPNTGELTPDDPGYVHSFDMEDINFMLVGCSDGMVLGGPLCSHFHHGKSVPGSDGTQTICSPAAVKRCDDRLSGMPAERVAPLELVFKHLDWSFDDMDDEDRRGFHGSLIEAANDFRQLVADAQAWLSPQVRHRHLTHLSGARP